MILYKNLNQILTLKSAHQKDGRHLKQDDLGLIEKAGILFDEQKIHWVGPMNELPKNLNITQEFDLAGHVLTPELVDAHTHLVFAGNRSDEYVMRLNGADYQAIANAGGGILSTANATRKATQEQLLELGRARIRRIASFGVGTIEIKSGYGLDYATEKKLSLVIKKLKEEFSPKIQIINTYMAAHAIPKEFSNAADYLEQVVYPLMTELAELGAIDQVDIFHEVGYFSTDDVKALAVQAKKLKLPMKTHADEFNDNRGAALAAELGALSCDHLLCSGQESIQALAQAKTVATLLPGTGFFLGKKKQADARAFLDAGAKVAIASDFNPGSCHFDQLLFIAGIAAPHYQMNLAQLWCAITYNAAHALGLYEQGALVSGLKPRFSLFRVNSLNEISYSWGHSFATPLPS